MKNRFLRGLGAVAAALVWMLAGTTAALAGGAPGDGTYRIVTLGDSLAAGFEPGLTEKSEPYGYSERLYEQALYHGRAKISNFGIIGLGTEGLIRLLQGAADGKTLQAAEIQDFSRYEDPRVAVRAAGVGARTAELKASLAEADLVVMTIGANDFGQFLTSVLSDSMDNVDKSLHGEFGGLVKQYTDNAEKAVREVSGLAPKAQILLSDQYLPLPKLFAPDRYDLLYELAVAPITAAVDGLAAKLGGEGLKVGAVHISGRFKGKEGSMTHMAISVSGGDKKPDIHPTQAGYQAIAQAFSEAVWQEYRKPAAKPAGVSVSLIVRGKEWLPAPVKPAVKKNVVFTDAGATAKALGAELKWTAKTKTAVFKKKGIVITIAADAKTFTVNGVKQKLVTPAFLQKSGKDNKLYVPLALIAAKLKYDVVYRSQLQTYFINP